VTRWRSGQCVYVKAYADREEALERVHADPGNAKGGVTSPNVWLAAYQAHAADYASHLDPTLAGATQRLAELAEASPGVRLLDLATGAGAVARAAAGGGASVVGVDLSPAMLALARELSPAIDFSVADAHSLPFDDAAFDVVTCGLTVSHFEDRQRALGEVLRVLRAGGWLVASTWGHGGGQTPAFRTVLDTFRRYRAAEKGYALDEETWLAAESGETVLREAGFERVSSETHVFTGRFADGDRALRWTLAWPTGAARLVRLHCRALSSFFTDARRALATCDLAWRFAFYTRQRPP